MTGRRLLALLFVLCVGALAPAARAAAFGGLDRGFGDRGVIDLSYEPSPGTYSVANEISTSVDGRIYVLGATVPCAGCERVVHLTRLRSNGARDWSYGDGTVELPTPPYANYKLAVDGRGRQLVAYIREGELAVIRVLPGGAIDPGFGDSGVVRFACACQGGGVRVRVDALGRIQVAVNGSERVVLGDGRVTYRAAVETRVLDEDGRLDPGFGGGGAAVYRIEDATGPAVEAGLPGGGSLVPGHTWLDSGIYAGRIGPRGRLDESFTARSRQALTTRLRRVSQNLIQVRGVRARADGIVDVFGQVGFEGFVARLRRDGSLERRFGQGGVRLVPWAIAAIVPGPGGRTFVLSGEESGQDHFTWLGREGRPLRSFAGGHWGSLDGFSSGISVALQRGSRPLVLDQGLIFCRSACPPKPRLVRFTRWAR